MFVQVKSHEKYIFHAFGYDKILKHVVLCSIVLQVLKIILLRNFNAHA